MSQDSSLIKPTDGHARLAIAELAELDVAHAQAQPIAYPIHQRRVRAATEHLRLPHLRYRLLKAGMSPYQTTRSSLVFCVIGGELDAACFSGRMYVVRSQKGGRVVVIVRL